MSRVLAVLALVVAACAAPVTIGPFIRDVGIRGTELVIERCTVDLSRSFGGDPEVSLGTCRTERRPLPVTTGLPKTVGNRELARAVTPAAVSAIVTCAHGQVSGELKIGMTIDPTGRLIEVRPSAGGPGIVDCIGGVLDQVHFPATVEGAWGDVTVKITPVPAP